jgi:hypothetical protein
MSLESKQKRALMIGGVIGAILGAGIGFLLVTAPSEESQRKPLSLGEIISLTTAAATIIRRLDDVRRRT